ncbi:MAG: CoA-binding protein [Alicyclobacillaceae bacterium]|nr:CoA-binding protein [Alicyclobacillaceae bacterium]
MGDHIPDETLAAILAGAKTIAVVGLTDSPGTPSYDVASYQQSQGYKVIPVNPEIGSSLGHKSYAKVTDVADPVDIVNVFQHGGSVHEAVEGAIQKGAKVVWMQPGVDDPASAQLARNAGLTVVAGRCFEREHRRLLSHQPL